MPTVADMLHLTHLSRRCIYHSYFSRLSETIVCLAYLLIYIAKVGPCHFCSLVLLLPSQVIHIFFFDFFFFGWVVPHVLSCAAGSTFIFTVFLPRHSRVASHFHKNIQEQFKDINMFFKNQKKTF